MLNVSYYIVIDLWKWKMPNYDENMIYVDLAGHLESYLERKQQSVNLIGCKQILEKLWKDFASTKFGTLLYVKKTENMFLHMSC